MKTSMLFAGVGFLLLGAGSSACTPPVYHHSYVTKYDAEGNVTGYEETESITQQSPDASPMKVKITKQNKIEK